MRRTWAELDEERQTLPSHISRAEWARRAGISESTITKGIRTGGVPIKSVREKVELVLEAERQAIAGGLR